MQTYFELLRNLNNNGKVYSPRNIPVKELINEHLEIPSNRCLISIPGIRDVIDPTTKEGKYLRAEFVWYMSKNLDTNYISNYTNVWSKIVNPAYPEFKDRQNCVNSNYGYAIFRNVFDIRDTFIHSTNNNMKYIYYLHYVLYCLSNDEFSRQAIIPYTDNVIYNNGVRDFTCTQNQHFLIRDNKLYSIVCLRSSDAIKGLTFDIPWWSFVSQLVAQYFDINEINLSVNIGSSHYYMSDSKLVDDILANNNTLFKLNLKPIDYICQAVNTILPKSEFEFISFINNEFKRKISKDVVNYDKYIYFIMTLNNILYAFNYHVNNRSRSSLEQQIEINNFLFDSSFEY